MTASNIPRTYLSQLTQNPRLIRYLEDLGTDVAGTLPELIDAAQLAAGQALSEANSANDTALQALDASLAEVQNSVNAVSAQVAELAKVIPYDNTSAVQSLLAEFAELRKSVKPKRIINTSIAVGPGATSATYTISPACDLATTLLNANGQSITAGLSLDSALLSLELTNSTTVTAQRGASSGTSTVYLQIVEY